MSVTDKTGIVDFARGLSALGVEILSTGGTYRVLKDAGIAPLREVAEVTGISRNARRPGEDDSSAHRRRHSGHALETRAHAGSGRARIPPIDLVCVNLYEFEKIAAKKDAPLEELIENIDIGGPTMIRAAAKNYQDVAVVTSPADYAAILEELRIETGAVSTKRTGGWRRRRLRQRPLTIAPSRIVWPKFRRPASHCRRCSIFARRERWRLRYGENPHQSAALYATGKTGIAGAEQLQGKELSYNNLVDLDAAWQLIQEFDAPASAIIKHTNPCGCAEGATLAESYRRAFEADPVSAFGGVLAFNRELDGETAAEIAKTFIEAIAAPGYSAEALRILASKKNLRLLRVAGAPAELVVKSISGGFLAQTPDMHRLARAETQVKTKRAPSEEEWRRSSSDGRSPSTSSRMPSFMRARGKRSASAPGR